MRKSEGLSIKSRGIGFIKSISFILLLSVVFLSGCKDTYYGYDIEKMEETCKDRGGINRFNADADKINCWCNDGSFHKLSSR